MEISMRKTQAIIKINGINCFYLYDEEIKKALSTLFKANLESDGKLVHTIVVELNSPPVKYTNINGKENN